MTASVRTYEPLDAEPTWEAYFQAIRRTASKDYSPEQIAAWAPEQVDLAEWNDRRLAVHTVVATVERRVVGFSDVTDDTGARAGSRESARTLRRVWRSLLFGGVSPWTSGRRSTRG